MSNSSAVPAVVDTLILRRDGRSAEIQNFQKPEEDRLVNISSPSVAEPWSPSTNGESVVAAACGTLVAKGGRRGRGEGYWGLEILLFAVHEPYQKQGIGKRLYHEILLFAAEKNVENIVVLCDTSAGLEAKKRSEGGNWWIYCAKFPAVPMKDDERAKLPPNFLCPFTSDRINILHMTVSAGKRALSSMSRTAASAASSGAASSGAAAASGVRATPVHEVQRKL